MLGFSLVLWWWRNDFPNCFFSQFVLIFRLRLHQFHYFIYLCVYCSFTYDRLKCVRPKRNHMYVYVYLYSDWNWINKSNDAVYATFTNRLNYFEFSRLHFLIFLSFFLNFSSHLEIEMELKHVIAFVLCLFRHKDEIISRLTIFVFPRSVLLADSFTVLFGIFIACNTTENVSINVSRFV